MTKTEESKRLFDHGLETMRTEFTFGLKSNIDTMTELLNGEHYTAATLVMARLAEQATKFEERLGAMVVAARALNTIAAEETKEAPPKEEQKTSESAP